MKFLNRVKHLRKKKYSAPTIFTIFIMICMAIIFSFETLGLTNKNKYLDLGIGPKVIFQKRIHESNNSMNEDDTILAKIIFKLSEENKVEKLIKTHQILIDAAKEQFIKSKVCFYNLERKILDS